LQTASRGTFAGYREVVAPKHVTVDKTAGRWYIIGGRRELMEEIYGVEARKGLAVVGGAEVLYCKLLAKFTAGAFLQELEEAVADGDTPRIASLAHSVKGVAANLGLEPLREIASRLEESGKSDIAVEPGSELFEEFRECYVKTRESAELIVAHPALLEAYK
jgi:HPt (histidine-containing phosphotransfer) domain-containing protein